MVAEASKFLEKLTLLLPGLSLLVAIMFDVGYFYGIEIGYFTFFSLSEHIVFSLQALPFAFAMVMFTSVFTVVLSALLSSTSSAGQTAIVGEMQRKMVSPMFSAREKAILVGVTAFFGGIAF